jgi:hypothetical protein
MGPKAQSGNVTPVRPKRIELGSTPLHEITLRKMTTHQRSTTIMTVVYGSADDTHDIGEVLVPVVQYMLLLCQLWDPWYTVFFDQVDRRRKHATNSDRST